MVRAPHYAQPTVTHSAPEFANQEQDVIRQSFNTGNHTWMKEALPVELGPDAVNMLRRRRMERSRLAEPLPQTWSKMTQLWGGGYHYEFEYMPDEYERRAAFEKEARLKSTEMREKICAHEWRHVSQEKRMKYERMIHDPHFKESYPYLGGDKDEELQTHRQWLRKGEITSPPAEWSQEQLAPKADASFLAGRGQGLNEDSRGSRNTLPMMISRLQARLDADWEDTTVAVSATEQDLVQVAFMMDTVDSERGVMAYMNVISKDVDVLGNLGLRKVSQLWGVKRDVPMERKGGDGASDTSSVEAGPLREHCWIFFLLMPKWVRMRPTDAFYTVHPRSEGSYFRMSAAGSSVLNSLGASVVDPPERKRQTVGASPAPAQSKAERRLQPTAPGSARDAPLRPNFSLIEQALYTLPTVRENGRQSPA